MSEEWKKVIYKGEEFPRLVSNLGNVKSSISGKLMAKCDNGVGYLFSFLRSGTRDGRVSNVTEYIHRLVATAFIPNPLALPQVNHKDYDKSNNCIENLEWSTRSDNILDAHAKGKMKKRTENGQINVLTKEQVIDLYTSVKKFGKGIGEKAREMGIPRTTASSIINKRSRWDITDLLDLEFASNVKK